LPYTSAASLPPGAFPVSRDYPIRVTLPDLEKFLDPGWKESFQNVHGEYSTFLLLSEFTAQKLPRVSAWGASEGWGGDRYAVVEDALGHTATVWFTTWDAESDAVEF